MIHLARGGSRGPLVVLLHGIGGSSESFAAQLTGLPGYRVWAWDAPGYGRSADPPRAPGMAGYALAVADLLRGREPAHLVGVSWGGVIATRLALEHPGLVRSLTLAGSTVGSGRSPENAAAMLARAGELTDVGPSGFAARRAPRLAAPGTAPELVERLTRIMAGVRQPGYGYAARAMAETDHSAMLPGLGVPALVLVGDQDRITGPRESRRLAEGIPGARLEVIPGAGHAANQERPDLFNAVLRAFLERNAPVSEKCGYSHTSHSRGAVAP